MATGDNEVAAQEVAKQLGINYHANLSPLIISTNS